MLKRLLPTGINTEHIEVYLFKPVYGPSDRTILSDTNVNCNKNPFTSTKANVNPYMLLVFYIFVACHNLNYAR